jgi:hypothetical protein
MLKWIKYSGASVILALNPLHWSLVPKVYKTYNEWAGPNEWTGSVTWLGLTIRVWIDDGSW